MIAQDKLDNALYALQGVLIQARALAYESGDPKVIAGLLDCAEHLPRLIARTSDETQSFRAMIEGVAEKYRYPYILQRFDEPVPPIW